MKYYIYTLNCPTTKEIRYVGKSSNPSKRLAQHLSDKSKSHKASWIKSLLNKNQIPVINIIGEFNDEKECYKAEITFIEKFKSDGADLTNHQIGGIGGTSENVRGSANGNSKVNEEQVLEIKDLLLFSELSIDEISDKLSIKVSTIQNIKYGRWSHLTGFTGKEKWVRGNSVKTRQKALIDSGMYEKQSISVEQYDLKNNLINTFASISEASTKTKTNRTSISQCLQNKAKTANNFIWKKKL